MDLTSVEFVAAVAGLLSPSGTYAANVGDGPPLARAHGWRPCILSSRKAA